MAQITYAHVSKCENDKTTTKKKDNQKKKKRKQKGRGIKEVRAFRKQF
jgi:hypothetical protein